MGHDASHDIQDDFNPLHLGLYLFGGACAGSGLLALYFSFGSPTGDLNQNVDLIGFSGLDNIQALGAADFAIPMVVVGALSLIFANAVAWRKTGGY